MEHDSLRAWGIQINKEHNQVGIIIVIFGYYLHAAVDRGIWNVSFTAAMPLRALAGELRIHAST